MTDDHVPSGYRELTEHTHYGHGFANDPDGYLGDGDQQTEPTGTGLMPVMPADDENDQTADEQTTDEDRAMGQRILDMVEKDARTFGRFRRFMT